MTRSMSLFDLVVPVDRLHPIFKMIHEGDYGPEREVLQSWAEGFVDRDGKFVKEFQTTFESGLWELYLNAAAKEWQLPIDFSWHAPDFVVGGETPFGLEATIASPAQGGKPAYGYSAKDIPDDFTAFNIEATLRICNSFSSKVKRYREYYSALPHMKDRAYVVGIASFDRPLAHLAAMRPAIAAFYGLYHDEAATSPEATAVHSYNVTAAPKNDQVAIDIGLFCNDDYADVSAIVFSSLVTWGKVRAMATNPAALTLYTTFHPQEDELHPRVVTKMKCDYVEHLLDGLVVLHNPFARRPIPSDVFAHPRIAQIRVAPDGELITTAPDDFLLVRMLNTVIPR